MSRDVRRVVPHVVRLGLLGLGSVGAAFAELVDDDREGIDRRVGLKLEITRIAVHDTTKSRGKLRRLERITGDAAAVVSDPEVDVVVELVGGIEPARSLILAALRAGKPVVTANKELLAQDGPELFAVAESAGRPLLFEAAVAGAIPLVRALRVSLVGEHVRRILGIVNGTTNYILSEMSEKGVSYASALETAQRLGYAERNPSADVGGHDAAAKAAILASIAFSADVVATDVYREGIEAIEIADIEFAHRLGYEVKLLAVAEQLDAVEGSPMIAVRVHPAMVPVEHPLATIRGPFNAVFVEGDSAGELMLFGRGAGGRPTASAVLGDVIDAAGSLGLEGGLRFAPSGTEPKSGRSASCAPSTTSRSTSRTARACSLRWRRCSASTTSRCARWNRWDSVTRHGSSSSLTSPANLTCRRPSATSPDSTPCGGSAG